MDEQCGDPLSKCSSPRDQLQPEENFTVEQKEQNSSDSEVEFTDISVEQGLLAKTDNLYMLYEEITRLGPVLKHCVTAFNEVFSTEVGIMYAYT